MNMKIIHGPLTSPARPHLISLNSGKDLFHSSQAETSSLSSLSGPLPRRKERIVHQKLKEIARDSDCSGSTFLQDANGDDSWKLRRNDLAEGCQSNINLLRKCRERLGSLTQVHFNVDTWRLYVTADNLAQDEGVIQC